MKLLSIHSILLLQIFWLRLLTNLLKEMGFGAPVGFRTKTVPFTILEGTLMYAHPPGLPNPLFGRFPCSNSVGLGSFTINSNQLIGED